MKKYFLGIRNVLFTLLIFLHAEVYGTNKKWEFNFSAKRKDELEPKKEFLVINPLRPTIGMYAVCLLVMGHLYLYDKGEYPHLAGMKVNFGSEGPYYDPAKGPNWWEYYFEPVCIGSSNNVIMKLPNEIINGKAWKVRTRITRSEAFQVIKKYIKPRAFITEKINKFRSDNFRDFFIIGIHYRGTDKAGPSHEAPRVPYDEAVRVIQEHIDVLSQDTYKIFVATDEQAFLDYIKQVFPEKVVFTDAYRSLDSSSVHHSDNNPYELGEQAVIDTILLSKCNVLIRTSSNLSLWASYLNPNMPVVMLSHRPGSTIE